MTTPDKPPEIVELYESLNRLVQKKKPIEAICHAITELLEREGEHFDLNIISSGHRYCLHYAVCGGTPVDRHDVVALLLEHRAKPSLSTTDAVRVCAPACVLARPPVVFLCC